MLDFIFLCKKNNNQSFKVFQSNRGFRFVSHFFSTSYVIVPVIIMNISVIKLKINMYKITSSCRSVFKLITVYYENISLNNIFQYSTLKNNK